MMPMGIAEIAEAVHGTVLNDNGGKVTHVSTDSRDICRGETLFVPVIGENTDAHRFLPDVERDEAVAAFISEDIRFDNGYIPGQDGMAVIRVKDTVQALKDLAVCYRNRIHIPLIGVTGSVGKTTTREMVAYALFAGYRVFRTKENHNSQIGVPLTLLEIDEKDQVGVIEMGMSFPGEMTRLSHMVRPACALVTNIGTAHIGQLGSRENIRAEKMKIQDGMEEGGTLFLNGDDDMLRDCTAEKGHPVVYYGTTPGKGNWADDIRLVNGCAVFHAHIGDKTVNVSLHVYGEHQVLNAMAALTVADAYGVDPEAAAEVLSGFTGFAHRQQIFNVSGYTVIDDTYNASPSSMKAAIDILNNIAPEGRKIAVLADMKELGQDTDRLHYEMGTYLAEGKKTDILLTLGKSAEKIAEGVRDAGKGSGEIEIHEFQDHAALERDIREYIKPGDAVLLKGSNSMKLSSIADKLTGHA